VLQLVTKSLSAGFATLALVFLVLFLVSTSSTSKGTTISGADTTADVLSAGQTIDLTSPAGIQLFTADWCLSIAQALQQLHRLGANK